MLIIHSTLIYKETIGAYLEQMKTGKEEGGEEKSRRQLISKPWIHEYVDEEEEEENKDEEEGESQDGSMKDFIVQSEDDDDDVEMRDEEDESRDVYMPHPYAGGVANLAALRLCQRHVERGSGETLLGLRLHSRPKPSRRLHISSSSSDQSQGGEDEEEEEEEKEDGGGEEEEADFSRDEEEEEEGKAKEMEEREKKRKANKRVRDAETLKTRFSVGRELLRFRCDGISRRPEGLRVIFEAGVCGAGHATCGCPDCPFEMDRSLLEKRRFADGRSLGRVAADDAFRTRVLELEHRVVVMYRCQWEAKCRIPGSPEAEFARTFHLPSSRIPIQRSFSEAELLRSIMDEELDGIIKCSLTIPERHRQRLDYSDATLACPPGRACPSPPGRASKALPGG